MPDNLLVGRRYGCAHPVGGIDIAAEDIRIPELSMLGLSGDELAISMPGGELTVSLTASGGSVQDIYLTGPTNVVCTGDILDEDVMG